jgi:hypothetical protein
LQIKANNLPSIDKILTIEMNDADRYFEFAGDLVVNPGGATISGLNSGNETTTTIGAVINGATAAVPNDADLVATVDTSVVKKITWTNVKAFLKTYFDTLYAPVASATLRYSADVGDAASTAIVITHSLGTRDLVASLRSNTTPWEQVMCDVEFTSTTTATLRFAVAPTSAQYRVTFVG